MSNLFTSYDREALGVRITLPVPADIPVPAIAEAVDALMTADDRLQRARKQVRASESAKAVANAADARRVDQAIRDGIDPSDPEQFPNPTELLDIAIEAEKKARGTLPTYVAMYREAYSNVTAAITEHGVEWATESARALDKALNGLVAARKKIEMLAADVEAAYGVVTLGVERGGMGYGESLSIADGRVTVSLDEATAALAKAMGLVNKRIDVAKAAHEAVAQ